MANTFTFIPANQNLSALTFGLAPFILRNFSGLGNAQVNEQSQKSPFQIGETFINTDITARIITINLRIKATDKEQLEVRRNELSRACVVEPSTTDIPDIALLRYDRDGQDTIEIPVVPRQSPQFSEIIPTTVSVDADLEFFCPTAYWQEIADSMITVTTPEIGVDQLAEVTEENFNTTGTNNSLLVLPNIVGT